MGYLILIVSPKTSVYYFGVTVTIGHKQREFHREIQLSVANIFLQDLAECYVSCLKLCGVMMKPATPEFT